MARYRMHLSSASAASFRVNFTPLDEALVAFGLWLQGDRIRGASTCAVYPSLLRSFFTRVLEEEVPPALAIRAAKGAALGAAMRMFLRFARAGGAVDGVKYPPFYNVIPDGVRDLIHRHFKTPLGDLMARCDMVAATHICSGLHGHGALAWSPPGPDAVPGLLLSRVLAAQPSGLYRLPAVFHSPPAAPFAQPLPGGGLQGTQVARAVVRIALFGHAGGAPDPATTPLFAAWPTDPEGHGPPRAIPSHVVWDLMGREPMKWDIDLPPEGEALLAGEAVDLSGVAPLYPPDVTPVTFRKLFGPRAANPPPLTPEETIMEHLDLLVGLGHTGLPIVEVMEHHGAAGVEVVRAMVADGRLWADGDTLRRPRPGGWNLMVNVTGVPALGEVLEVQGEGGEPEAISQDLLTPREDVANFPAPHTAEVAATPGEVAETGGEDAETPPPAGPTEAFDAPELPPV